VVYILSQHFLVYLLLIGVQTLEVIHKNQATNIHSTISALIMGMTQYTTKAHIVRAALEGIAYQTREVKYSFLFFSSKIYL
jgi:sugar (pentulose or hexulose) kinase